MENKISVAMATYNGQKYINEQISSILQNLSENDELVISDDGSNDNTLNIIKSFEDKRIKLIQGPKKGIKKNFENAIRNTTGDIIFLSDQDDVWMENKVKTVKKYFNKDKELTLVMHNAKIVNDKMERIEPYSTFKWRKSRTGVLHNIIKNCYVGCTMAFTKEIKEIILPIPDDINMHDQWIGILSDIYGKNMLVEDELIDYRRHGDNNTGLNHTGLNEMFINRIKFIFELNKRKKAMRKEEKC